MRSIKPMSVAGLVIALIALAGTSGTVAAERGSPSEIPEGAVEFKGHHYLLVDRVEDLSWELARDRCAAIGAQLVVVNDREESDFVAGLCDGRYMYLGATDSVKEGTWAWIDGSEWQFTNWYDGQPNDYGGHENYLATYDDGEWVDVEAEGGGFWMPTGYICEWSR